MPKRVYIHRIDLLKGFSKKYKTKKLLYYEVFDNADLAIKREKQLKGWRREKKINLIMQLNPNLDDLYFNLT